MLPRASTNAERQSANPAPVRSRSSFTICAEILTGSSGFVIARFIPSVAIFGSWAQSSTHSPAVAGRLVFLFGGAFYGIVGLRFSDSLGGSFRFRSRFDKIAFLF